MVAVDDMNRRILNLLKTDGKLTYREIAAKLRRSPSTVRDRIRRMEDYNVILGYAAIVDIIFKKGQKKRTLTHSGVFQSLY